jgi:putative lipase involved disintegration of autophagic bodies
VLQLGTAMLPLPFSMALEATIVSLISSLKFGMSTYASSVLAAANRAQSRFPNDTIYIVGHSLGGFTANIVAAQGNFQGVAFSPMGTGMQYKRFGFPVRTADMTLLSIVPEHDLVPKVDVQLGMLQQIVSIAPCDFSNMFCHSMGLTMATLATNCGDPLGRTVGTCHSP